MKKQRSSRRYSDDEYDDDKPRGDYRDEGYRSDGYRDQNYRRSGRGDGHTRFDGGDDGGFDEINNRPRRQRIRPARRDEDDRYGYGDGHRPTFRDTNPRKPRPQKEPPYPSSPQNRGPPDSPHVGFDSGPAAMGHAATMSASSAYGSPPPGLHPGAQSTSSLRGGISTGYVPYAHIYGGPTHPQSQQGDFAPSPTSERGSVHPSFANQVVSPSGSRPPVKRHPAGYEQNPLAQEAPAGNQPGYLVDPHHGDRHFDERHDGDDDRDERHGSRSPPHRRASRREDSRDRRGDSRDRREHSRSRREDSRDRYESPDSRDGRHSQRRERSRHSGREKSRGAGKSVIEDNIDTSQRGLGYTAVGALGGGLLGEKVGEKVGKGFITSSLGAVVGAAGANAFQARERYVDDYPPRKSTSTRLPPKPVSR